VAPYQPFAAGLFAFAFLPFRLPPSPLDLIVGLFRRRKLFLPFHQVLDARPVQHLIDGRCRSSHTRAWSTSRRPSTPGSRPRSPPALPRGSARLDRPVEGAHDLADGDRFGRPRQLAAAFGPGLLSTSRACLRSRSTCSRYFRGRCSFAASHAMVAHARRAPSPPGDTWSSARSLHDAISAP